MRRLIRRGTRENRIVSKHHPLDTEDRLFDFSTSIVAGPFAERPLKPFLVVTEFAFEHDLGIRWYRQARVWSPQHFQWLFTQAANPIELRETGRHWIAGSEKKKRINTDYCHRWTRLSAREVFVAMKTAMFARRDVTHSDVWFDDLNTIRAGVDPSGIGISGDDGAGCSDIPSSVQFMMNRDREPEHVNRGSFQNVFEDAARLHVGGRDVLNVFHAVAVPLQVLHCAVDFR